MLNSVIKYMRNPLDDINVDLGVDQPLWKYVKQAIQDIEVLNLLMLNPTKANGKVDKSTKPFIHVGNWNWNPYPLAEEIKYRRRETADKLSTKFIGNTRIGILSFDIYCGARDKNNRLETAVVSNKIYIPIEDDQGRYLIDKIQYPKYQLVDQLLYPSGKDEITLKSLLPIVVKYEDVEETSIDGRLYNSKIGMVKIFSTMEPIMACFMHTPMPLSYLEVFPILQFCDHVDDDKDEYDYFKPLPDVEIYVKGFKKGLEEFSYVRNILVMSLGLIRKHKPPSINEMRDPAWWTYQLSYNANLIEQRGACHVMYVARMLDTISATVLPIPDIDKRNMIGLLKYILQTHFVDINIFSFDNKRLRLNEVISTIITAEVSQKLKKMFTFGVGISMKNDMLPLLKFNPQIILKNMYKLQTIHSIDFANDLDYPHQLKYTKNGPNSLGRLDKHKIAFVQKQLHPSMIGKIDLLESPKDVGQSGMISPWADLSSMSEVNTNKYPNIKFELFTFIQKNFGNPALTLNANNIVEYNNILDKLVQSVYIDIDYYIDRKKQEKIEEKKEEKRK